jgi:hypothetical protein
MKAGRNFSSFLTWRSRGWLEDLSDASATIGAIEKLCLSKVKPDVW